MESAATRVFAIFELAEKILIQVAEPRPGADAMKTSLADLMDIYCCKRVSRSVASVIAGSNALQHIMSITSRSAEEYSLKTSGCAPSALFNGPISCCWITIEDVKATILSYNRSNSDFAISCEVYDCPLAVGLSDHADASWRKMRCAVHTERILVRVNASKLPDWFATTQIKFKLPADTTFGRLVDLLKEIHRSVKRGTLESGQEIMGVEILAKEAVHLRN